MNGLHRNKLGDGLGATPLVDASTPSLTAYLSCRTTADMAVAATLLIVTAPLNLLLVLLIKMTSPGPALYKQMRLGRGGVPFQIYKFRTMTHDCERFTGPQWAKKQGDSRVTPLGRILRKTHLDEIPQLFNVLRGEMSLVGPRPERPEFVARLEREIPRYRERLEITPGITGLAQVQLPPDEDMDDVRRKVRCDLRYIAEINAWLDFKILVATALKIMGVPFAQTRRWLGLPGGIASHPDRVDCTTSGEAVASWRQPVGATSATSGW